MPTHVDDGTTRGSVYTVRKLAQLDFVSIACGVLGIGHTNRRLQKV